MEFSRLLVTVLCVVMVLSYCVDARRRKPRSSKRKYRPCRARSMVRYQMTVTTVWDKDTFPKMYPTYRPPAHWSKLIGRTHGATYRMWQEGANASLAVEKFAEEKDSEVFDLEFSQGYKDILDAFVAPTIKQGVGETSAVLMVDAAHPKVSFMMSLVPSPDWFVGLDSVDLCYRGRWKKKLQRDLRPFDAGTDQGYTFTAPNWPTDPKEPISAITSSSPDHPASSFFYPEYKVLPPLGRVEFEMVAEYRLRKVHKEVKTPEMNLSDIATTTTTTTTTSSERPENNDKARNDDPAATKDKNLFNSIFSTSDGGPGNSNGSHQKLDTIPSTKSSPELKALASALSGEKDDNESKHKKVVVSPHRAMNIVPEMRSLDLGLRKTKSSISRDGETGVHKKFKSLRERPRSPKEPEAEVSTNSLKEPQFAEVSSTLQLKEYHKRRDCFVSEWSEWSPCSKTCGFGNRQRSREAIELPKNGGAYCPLLKEDTLCGSMRNCRWSHFSFMRRSRKPRFGSLTRGRRLSRKRMSSK